MIRRAFTIIEVLIVVAIIALLVSIMVGAFSRAKRLARLATCAQSMRAIHIGLASYATAHKDRLPPFAFSSPSADLAISGHWGGVSQPGDPDGAARRGMETVNLWAAVDEGLLSDKALVCPAARAKANGEAFSYFPHSRRFSTYCVRMPYSEGLFAGAEPLMNRYGGLLGAYRQAAGGQQLRVGAYRYTVPLVRTDREYAAVGGEYTVDMGTDVLMSDGFVRGPASASAGPSLETYTARADWWHDDKFNVLAGDGSVRTIEDDGTIRSAVGALNSGADPDGHATEVEQIWHYFDENR